MDQTSQPTYLSRQNSHRRFRGSSNRNLVATSVLLVLLATLIPISLASSTCNRHEYWDMQREECVLCTKCNSQEIVSRPCQRHMNTICAPLNAIEIDWSKSMAMENHPRHHHKPAMETFSAQTSEPSENELVWDWQLISMILAVAACLLFFVGTALVSINYIRQWRQIKKQFDNGELT